MNRPGPRGGAGRVARAAVLGLAGGLLSGGCSGPPGAEADTAPWLVDVRCAEALRATLDGWGAGEDAVVAPPAAGAWASYRFPTDSLGVWVVLDLRDAGATVRRVAPDRVDTRQLGERCDGPVSESVSGLGTDRDRFGDVELRGAVAAAEARGARGVVVYTWSPHMPLSVDGYAEIEEAAAAHGLDLIAVLQPGSDAGFADVEASRMGLPAGATREAASVELRFRDASVHAPSILIFDGSRVSAVLPGYRTAEGYREFLAGFTDEGF